MSDMNLPGSWRIDVQGDLSHIMGQDGEHIATTYGKDARRIVECHNRVLAYMSTSAAAPQDERDLCKGTNCKAVAGIGHSPGCEAEHDATVYAGAGNRWPEDRYAGYKGQPCRDGATNDQRAAWNEGFCAALPAQAVEPAADEPVYQWRRRGSGWSDCTKERHDDILAGDYRYPDGQQEKDVQARTLYTRPAPLPSADVHAALDAVDDFIARCNADDRGACESVNVLRAALAAPAKDVAPSDAQPPLLNCVYETQSGEAVKFVAIHNAGTSYETMEDQHGVNRYTRRAGDIGRVTGTPHDWSDPRNLPRLAAQPAAQPADAQDAARYRWLCDRLGVTKLPCAIEQIIEGGYIADGKPSIDAAIDAAIARTQEGAAS